ncbi:hypothetical protein D3C78_1952930 [compost metagenome]
MHDNQQLCLLVRNGAQAVRFLCVEMEGVAFIQRLPLVTEIDFDTATNHIDELLSQVFLEGGVAK